MKLSILMVSRGEDHAWPFVVAAMRVQRMIPNSELVVCGDGPEGFARLMKAEPGIPGLRIRALPSSPGYVEAILDAAVERCIGDYVLRLDDDETISPAMTGWLGRGQYASSDVWRFPRVHFVRDTRSVLMTKALFPDWQIRLTTRAKAGGRERRPHSPSPFGIGQPAPVCMEHHKFLVKDLQARREVAARYDAAQTGLGTGQVFKVFSLPEEVYGDEPLRLVEYKTGETPWTPEWEEACTLS